MKLSKSEVVPRYRSLPEVQIVDPQKSNMTSFAGLVIFQKMFNDMNICSRLRTCFSDESKSPIYGFHRLALWLVIHLILGYRQIKDVKYYEHDPLVLRMLNLKRMPDPSSFSRAMNGVEQSSIDKLSALMTENVCERLSAEKLPRITMDFDGSVISTSRSLTG